MVLLVDDDRDMRWAMRNILADAGFDVTEAEAGGIGLELASRRTPAAVLLDMRMPGIAGEEVLRRLRRLDPGLPVIIVTAHGTISGAVSAIREGAFEYVTKPFRNEHLVETVRRAVARRSVPQRAAAGGIRAALTAAMGQGPAIQTLAAQAEAVVSTDYSVIIKGETGAGKEVVARNLHEHGPRANRPLVVIDCGAIAETLTDSEFFGHEKGAFTGANERRRGSFESAANGGTIFLDEVGNLALTGQKALLRTLEDHSIRRVGGADLINLDVRVIAATNDNLKERAKTGGFREDLYFRLTEYVITIPPLRARPEDISFLAHRFLRQARDALARPPIEIEPAALDLLRAYRWPGNVRELRNVMRRAALAESQMITVDQLADSLGGGAMAAPAQKPLAGASLRHRVRDQVRAIERNALMAALEQAKGNKAEAARLLGIDYKTYRTKLKMLGERQGAAADEPS
ncbi:sigma-54 dependent transcriptional regulator [Methylocapsa polymorpha]|uniref:Sigma-54 dependent transcriptional regulator n=1 Tax=Methylocapsa polymorpha TaxID=3080828 RepID=A0ABZ0HPP1_9HYPH|nr:sigma-54 dependent transcriptional regulator [Methylocapsa sp. RX1]